MDDSRELARVVEDRVPVEATRTFSTFRLGGDLFGIDVHRIKEVARVPLLTPIPHAPPPVRGYANLRGQILLVLDLSRLLERGATEIGPETRIVTFKLDLGDPFGVLVDRLGEVLQVGSGRIEEKRPDDTAGGSTPPAPPHYELVAGVGKLAGDLLTILDASKFLPSIEQILSGRGQPARQELNSTKEKTS